MASLFCIAALLAPGESLLAQCDVQVTLRQVQPLKLVEFVYGKSGSEVGLDGVLEVTLRNTGSQPVSVRDLHVHGLLFVNEVTKEEVLLIHPCDCFFVTGDAEPPAGQVLSQTHRLAPGESQRFILEDFGCGGGMWEPPPPGKYLLYFRVLPEVPHLDSGVEKPQGRNPSTVLPECRKTLLSKAFWAGAAVSAPLEITLKKPVKKRV